MADDFFTNPMDDDSDFLAELDSLEADLDLDSWLNDLNLGSEDTTETDISSFDFPDPVSKKRAPVAPVAKPAPRKLPKAPKESKPEKLPKPRKEPKPEKAPKPRKEPKPEKPLKPNPFLDFVAQHRIVINALLLCVAVLLLFGIGGLLFVQNNVDPYDGRIIPNVYVAGINVGGLTESEALTVLNNSVGDAYSANTMIVTLGKEQVSLSPQDTHANLNAAAAAKAAYSYGRSGSTADRQEAYRNAQVSPVNIDLTPFLNLDTDYIRSMLTNSAGKISGTYTPSGYELEGERPALDADGFDASVPCQTLVLTVGSPGSNINVDGLFYSVMEAYSLGNFRLEADSRFLPEMPKALDLNAILAAVSIDPVEASEDPATKVVTTGSCGYTFDIAEAQEKLRTADYGDTVEVSMQYVKPNALDILGDFPEVLSTFSSPVSKNADYNKNLALICKAINGTVIPSGSTFIFNNIVPKRNAANGFLSAPDHGDYCLSEVIGGGADQVASTVYVSALSANMEIVQKNNGDHVCGYTIRGTEVSVSQSWQDLKFRNTSGGDIVIRAKVTDSQVIVKILGKTPLKSVFKVESEDSYTAQFGTAFVEKSSSSGFSDGQVLIEGIAGGSMRVFKVEYDKDTNKEIGRTNVGYVEMPSISKQIVRIK